jgi:GT2 family glycosyltransferase
MKLKTYRLHDQAVPIQPAAKERTWVEENQTLFADLALDSINGKGWDLLCPIAFEATWNGGPKADDIEIQLDQDQTNLPSFVQSHLGEGLLTFHPGYQFQTEGPNAVWIRGPVNQPKPGLYPLESLVDTSLLPSPVTINWKFTHPNQTVRFAAGESFGTILPYPKDCVQTFTQEEAEFGDDLEAYEQVLQQLAQSDAVQSVFERLGANVAIESHVGNGAVTNGHLVKVAASRWADQLCDPPPVSCICPTYGRVHLLEEAIYAFFQQDYPGEKELIVLNDYDQQTLEFNHPEVKVVNVPKRFSSIGEKYKAATALCSHDLVFVWHDDDIYLPHRLSYSVANMNEDKAFFKADKAWYWNDGNLSGPEHNIFHGGSCWTRSLFVDLHGYPHLCDAYDLEFENLVREKHAGSIQIQSIKPQDVYYIYRWSGTDSYHFSVISQNGHAYQDVAAYVQKQADQGQIERGQIALSPHWKTDYRVLVQNYLQDNQIEQTEDKEIPFPPPLYAIPPPQPMAEEKVAQLFQGTYPANISVILPAANESVLLKRTVEQFVATLPANCEVIVVDNGSTDGSADFLLNQPWENVHLIQNDAQLGVARARNRGLDLAQGEIVVFSDAHMDLPQRWWQPIAAVLKQPQVGVVGPGIGIMGTQPSTDATSYGQRIIEPRLGGKWLPLQQDQKKPYQVPSLGGGFMAMRHDVLKEIGAFDAGMPQWGSEDLELCIRYWLLGYEVWVVPEVTVMHYYRKVNPNKVEWTSVTHNLLRVALLHFSQDRLARVISTMKDDAKLGEAMAHAANSDVWQKRTEFDARRVRDDDWLFEYFKM